MVCRRIETHLDRGGGDASPVGVRSAAAARGGRAVEASCRGVPSTRARVSGRRCCWPRTCGCRCRRSRRCGGPIASWVRKVIHEFNERGMDSLRPRYRGGRPRRITTDQRQRIVSVAGARPDSAGDPADALVAAAARSSPRRRGDRGLAASSRHAARRGRPVVSAHPHLEGQPRPRLRSQGRPDARSVRGSRPRTAPVMSFDQMGPVSLRPTAGAGWAPQGAARAAARDYNRRAGIRYVFGAYDVHADRLRVRLRPQRAGSDMLAFMRQIRLALPRPTTHLLDPGQPLGQLDTRHPRLRRRATGSSSSRPRPTPATSTRSSATSPRSADSSSTTPTTSTGTPSDTRSPTTSATATRPPRPTHRRRRSHTPHRRLMPLPVQPNFKGH